MAAIRLAAFDLDGTLAIDNHQVTPATRDALHELQRDGVEIVVATGRRYRSARWVIENLGLDTCCVCNGGALVKDHGQITLASTPFNQTDYPLIVESARQCGIALSAQRDAHHLGGADFVIDAGVPWNPRNHQYFDENKDVGSAADLLASPDEYLVFGAYDSLSKLSDFQTLLSERCNNVNSVLVKLTNSDYYYCEVILNTVDKWHGLSALLAHLAIDDAETCAVGDELNDVPMIMKAQHGIAMSNGHEDLKTIANFVCGHNEQDGLLEAVRYIREHNDKYG